MLMSNSFSHPEHVPFAIIFLYVTYKWNQAMENPEVYRLLYEPRNHEEVLFMFSKMHKEIDFPLIIKVRTGYPDVIAVDKKGERVFIEIEPNAKSFQHHVGKHNIKKCDYIVCWNDDLKEKKHKDWQINWG